MGCLKGTYTVLQAVKAQRCTEVLSAAAEVMRDFFDRCNRAPERTRFIIDAHPA